ncbi:MAG TPA: LPP20 family lipoprotein, partial [Caulobacteraceae bacterium]|nr:LPP20 family lipoprotein [Caulobacteraceae bacterium]
MKGPILVALGVAAIGVAGCSSTPTDPTQIALAVQQKQQQAQLEAIKAVVDQAPSWYVTPPSDPGYMYGAGTATSGDLQFAIDKASLNAKRAVADQVNSKLSADQKDFLQESGSSYQAAATMQDERTVHNVVAEVDLEGYQVTERKVLPSGSGYRA